MIHEFVDTIFQSRVTLFVGSRDELLAYILETHGKKGNRLVLRDAMGQAIEIKTKSKLNPNIEAKAFIVWLVSFDGSPMAASCLTHECIHAAMFVFDHLGVNPNGDDEEVITYFTDAMVRQFLTALGAPTA